MDVGHRQIMRYIKQYLRPAVRDIPRGAYHWNQTLMQFEFIYSGGLIDFGSAERPELLEGTAYDLIIINEAGIILKSPDIYFNTLLPMGAEGKGAEWLFIGTPKGKQLFYSLYLNGLDPLQSDWFSIQVPTMENPLVSQKEIERLRINMPKDKFRQEFLAEFLSDGGEFFTEVATAAVAATVLDPPFHKVYVIGVDLAKHRDFTVFWVGDVESRSGIYTERFNRLPWPETCKRLFDLSQKFNRARIVLDSTGLGDVILDDLRHMGLNAEGITFSNNVKEELLTTLQVDIEQHRLTFISDKSTLAEMDVFERVAITNSTRYRLTAPPGAHDDCVISLALMNHALGRPAGLNELFLVPGIGTAYPESF